MRGQLHAGQLRYHDFTLLREGHLLKQSSIYNQNKILKRSSFLLTDRSFFTSIWSQKYNDFKLKIQERVANRDHLNVNTQYNFIKELSVNYPEQVIQRFLIDPNFAVDERCALLYLLCLQRTGKLDQFHSQSFLQRLKLPSGLLIDPIKYESLQDFLNDKSKSKRHLAVAAMKYLGAGSSHFSPTTLIEGVNGASPKTPLHVNLMNSTSIRDLVFKVGTSAILLFIAVSAISAVLDERGVTRSIGGGGKHMQQAEGSNVRFKDVKGVEEAKQELEEIVLYLKDPAKFTRLGGKLPRGLLLTGPPGTGKTLLAKAIAGEADVPFFFSSGSQFEEVYVGLGAKRIRELFEAAKNKAPAIIFIDEIDAVGGSRKLKDQSALKMTLNELLVQLDGFEDNNGIIVIGATNFAESLDTALLRPGRFDKNIVVPLPDVGGRKEILEMYGSRTKLAPDVDLNKLARGTVGFSGADLYNLMNQAALKASVDGLNSITMSIMEYAKDKIMMGAERKTAVITPETARCTAYHEAGHAVIAALTEGADPVHKATIMPRGQSLGMVMLLPEGDRTSKSFKQYLASMDVCMGGRIGEELMFGPENVTSGAVSDIQQATNIARALVTKFGFSDEVGFVYQEKASGKTKDVIEFEVKKIIDASYKRAKELLKKNSKEHVLLAETLLEYETLTGDEVMDILKNGKKPNKPKISSYEKQKQHPKLI